MFFGFLFIAISLYLISWVCLPSLYYTRRLFVVVAAARTNHDERLLCNLICTLITAAYTFRATADRSGGMANQILQSEAAM